MPYWDNFVKLLYCNIIEILPLKEVLVKINHKNKYVSIMGFFGVLAIIVILAIVLRLLRSIFVWMDYVAGAIIIIASIVMWISGGFWVALITLFVASIAVSLLFGLGSKTKWIDETGRYSITCYKCNYGRMEILSSDENGIYARCKRCGDTRRYNY